MERVRSCGNLVISEMAKYWKLRGSITYSAAAKERLWSDISTEGLKVSNRTGKVVFNLAIV